MIFTLSPSLKKISRIFLYKNTVDEGESSHLVSNYARTLFCSECKSDFKRVSLIGFIIPSLS